MLSRVRDVAVRIVMDTSVLDAEAQSLLDDECNSSPVARRPPKFLHHPDLGIARSMVEQLTFADIAHACSLESLNRAGSESGVVHRGVGFFGVLNHFAVSVTLITLEAGACIPLHDHSCMWVYSKVLAGELEFTKFDLLQPLPPRAMAAGELVAVSNRRTATVKEGGVDELQPTVGNVHRIANRSSSMAVLLDVVFPPYVDDESCHYFEETASEERLRVIDEGQAWRE